MRLLPLIILISFMAMDMGFSLAKHGKKRNTKYNFWISLISNAIIGVLVWWMLK